MFGVYMPLGPSGQVAQAIRWGTTQKISPAGASAAIATAFGANTQLVRVVATAAMNVAFAVTPTAVATDPLIPANAVEYIAVKAGDKLAALGTGDVYVTEAEAIA